jgi:HEAT repeat protein
VRLWSAERLLAWADPRTLPTAQARYPKEKDTFVRSTLLLLRATLGDAESLPDLEKLVQKEWSRWRDRAHLALQGLRSKATSDAMLERLQGASNEDERLFALRVLAGVGERSAIDSISTYLDADARALREAAMNALRAIVDRQEPLHDVSVFDLVQMIDDWKKRLPGMKR